MYRRVLFSAVLLLASAAIASLQGASLKDIIKVGVVDTEKLFAEYASKSRSALILRKRKARFAKEIRRGLERIKRMEQELRHSSGLMSDSERRRRMAEIEFKKDELATLIARRNRQLERAEKSITKPILKEIYAAIRDVARRQGVKVVLDSRSYIAYHDPGLDLTNLVMNRLRLRIYQKGKY